MKASRYIFYVILVLSSLFLRLDISRAEDEDSGYTYKKAAEIEFKAFDNVRLNLTFQRYFLDSLEYSFGITSKFSYNSDTEMFELDILPNESAVLNAPYAPGITRINSIYGVIELKNSVTPDNYQISLMESADNPGSITLAPGIENLEVLVEMPPEAITIPDQDSINFPGVRYDNTERTAYVALKLLRPMIFPQIVNYELVERETEQEGKQELVRIFEEDYQNSGQFRLYDDPITNRAQILRRVSFYERNPGYFNGRHIRLNLQKIQGMIVDDASNHQTTISGTFAENKSDNDQVNVFVSVNNDPDPKLDRPIKVIEFGGENDIDKFNYDEDSIIEGPPLYLNWQVFPYTNTSITVNGPNGSIYNGKESVKNKFLVPSFASGDYFLVAKNSLGSRMVTLKVNPIKPRMMIYRLDKDIRDPFGVSIKETLVTNRLEFNESEDNQNIRIETYGIAANDLSFSPELLNQKKSLIIQKLSEKSEFNNLVKTYHYQISQLKPDSAVSNLIITTGNLKTTLIVKPNIKMSENTKILPKDDVLNITAKLEDVKNLFISIDTDYLIFKKGLQPEDFEKIANKNIRDQIQEKYMTAPAEIPGSKEDDSFLSFFENKMKSQTYNADSKNSTVSTSYNGYAYILIISFLLSSGSYYLFVIRRKRK